MFGMILSYMPGWAVFAQAGVAMLVPLLLAYLYKSLYRLVGSGRGQIGHGARTLPHQQPQALPESSTRFTGDFHADLQAVKAAIGSNSDVHFREFTNAKTGVQGVLIHIDGMQSDRLLSMEVMQFLMYELPADLPSSVKAAGQRLPFSELKEEMYIGDFNRSVLFGHAAILIEGQTCGFLVEMPGAPSRTADEPVSEALLRGPRLGFTEVLGENTAMLRRQGLSDQLEMKSFRAGTVIEREIVVAYMKDIVNPDLLDEVKNRIGKLNMDFLAESGYIEQLVEDNYLSPFQQLQNTERPDRVIAALLEGRVAIMLDGTPFALIAPVTFSMLLQSPEDYYERWLPGTLLRLLRFAASFLALMAPALYISFISFHPGLIPTELAITIIKTRQGVPFPSLIEVLILEVSIEILREAGIRLPKPIGPAMGIVGGLIIGDAAVQAGIVSPFLVITVAVTAISSFSIPMYSAGITLRILRFVGMLFASVLGMYGTILFFLLICCHLTKLKSFGVPYLTPLSPFRLSDWKDLFFRAPMALMKRRPLMMKTRQKQRKR
ncbi:spore germination protein [Paenibacillus sp. FSL K6-1096]|uniref:spore germination protein n=1 Tax=Paenibacillus sp. FSL K6-1096 TaxID=2921460 RepID=UPI0030EF323E